MAGITKEELRNLHHILKHLEANNIHQPDSSCSGWYSSDRKKFVARHVRAIAYVKSLLGVNNG